MAQLNINIHAVCTRHNTFLISLAYIHAHAHEIDDVKTLVQSTCVDTICVHDNLYEHTCLSVTYMANLVCIHLDIYMNCKPSMTVQTL